MKNLVLASKSPRRREILKKSGFDFSLVNSDYEEDLSDNIFSYKKIENLAKNKAFGAINNVNQPSYILSADTVVILDNTILIKPKNREDAIKMLHDLSNKTHEVVTSMCILDSETEKFYINSTTTKVEFNLLTDQMIEYYVDNFKPFDKAGAYGIQELPDGYVKQIVGDKENVIGLSSNAVKESILKLDHLLMESQEKSSYLQD